MTKLAIILVGLALVLAGVAVVAERLRWLVVFAALLSAIALVLSVTPGRATSGEGPTNR